MHMADALISPTVGLGFWAVSGALVARSARKLGYDMDTSRAPMMGVMGAFVFAAQMINFTIPGTGSSGHLGGGLLLGILLGPHAAFIALAGVLTVQCLLFADGGLLALGCNIFNLGVFPCFVGLPIYRAIAGDGKSGARAAAGAIVAAVIGLELGALSVVGQTVLSGISELPFGKFVLFMAGIHLPIGLVEGLVTLSVAGFVTRTRPQTVSSETTSAPPIPARVLGGMFVLALAVGGVLAWYASGHPDGLEWSIFRAGGHEELESQGLAERLGAVQEKTAILPDYSFREQPAAAEGEGGDGRLGTSVSGVVGSMVTLAGVSAVALGIALVRGRRASSRKPPEQ